MSILGERNTFVISNFPFRDTLEDSELALQSFLKLAKWRPIVHVAPIATHLLVHQMPESRFNLLQIQVYCRSSVIFPLKFSLNDKSTGPKIDVRRPRFNGERLIGANKFTLSR